MTSIMTGSSPRMRGTPLAVPRVRSLQGIIPAYAGNTDACHPDGRVDWDHPRVCGEHSVAGQVDAV